MPFGKHAAVSVLMLGLWGIAAAADPPAPLLTTVPSPADANRPNFWNQDTLTNNWFGLGRVLQHYGVTVTLSTTDVYQADVSGGLSTHNHAGRNSGKYDLKGIFDLDKLVGLPGGAVYVQARQYWSDGINSNSVGAATNVNANILMYHQFFVKQLYYEQKLFGDVFTLRAGRMDLANAFNMRTDKVIFDSSRYAYDETFQFLNYAFKHSPTIPFPQPGMAVLANITPVKWWYLSAAVADADAKVQDTGFETAFHGPADAFSIYETGFRPEIPSPSGTLPGTYRAGFWYDPRFKSYLDHSGQAKHDDLGPYLGFDQMVWRENADPNDDQGLGLFGRWGLADKNVDPVWQSFSAGAQYQGLIPTRDKDVLGAAVGCNCISPDNHPPHSHETILETYYNIRVTGWLSISPDVQYIWQPARTPGATDALVVGVRLKMSF
ncbi:MAG: carbohydrate porin [Phycisphaerae bacterium]|jgi:porin